MEPTGDTDLSKPYISQNKSDDALPSLTNNLYYDDTSYWTFSNHDIPILIGAAAGAIGLIIIFLAAALIWHCCQFALQRDKSNYSLENESEKNSVSSHGSNLYINNPESQMIVKEKSGSNDNSDQNMRRSISAPLTRQAPKNSTQLPVIKSVRHMNAQQSQTNAFACVNNAYMITQIDSKVNDERSVVLDMNQEERTNHKNEYNRGYIYETNSNHNTNSPDVLLKSRSLPWAQSNKRHICEEADVDEPDSKVNFSKKRKNRMRNDSAAAIAMILSGANPTNHVTCNHKDTDTLVDNEAVVVYDERTAL